MKTDSATLPSLLVVVWKDWPGVEEKQFRFYGDLLFGCWRLRGQRVSVRYLESHENEFEWFPHSYNALMLMPWRDGQPLNYEESMGEA